MALGFFYFLGGLIIISLISMVGYFIYMITREKQDPENQSILINFMSQYSGGFSLGTIDSIQTSKEITKITFFPRDLNYIRLSKKENATFLKSYTIFVLNKNLQYLPSGSLSGHRNYIMAFPPRAEELPEKLKESKFGEILMQSLSTSETNLAEERHLRKVISGISKLNDLQLPDEVVKNFLEKQKELGTSVSSNNLGEKKEEK